MLVGDAERLRRRHTRHVVIALGQVLQGLLHFERTCVGGAPPRIPAGAAPDVVEPLVAAGVGARLRCPAIGRGERRILDERRDILKRQIATEGCLQVGKRRGVAAHGSGCVSVGDGRLQTAIERMRLIGHTTGEDKQRVKRLLRLHACQRFLKSGERGLIACEGCGLIGVRHSAKGVQARRQLCIDIGIAKSSRVPTLEGLCLALQLGEAIVEGFLLRGEETAQSKLIEFRRAVEPSVLNDEMRIAFTLECRFHLLPLVDGFKIAHLLAFHRTIGGEAGLLPTAFVVLMPKGEAVGLIGDYRKGTSQRGIAGYAGMTIGAQISTVVGACDGNHLQLRLRRRTVPRAVGPCGEAIAEVAVGNDVSAEVVGAAIIYDLRTDNFVSRRGIFHAIEIVNDAERAVLGIGQCSFVGVALVAPVGLVLTLHRCQQRPRRVARPPVLHLYGVHHVAIAVLPRQRHMVAVGGDAQRIGIGNHHHGNELITMAEPEAALHRRIVGAQLRECSVVIHPRAGSLAVPPGIALHVAIVVQRIENGLCTVIVQRLVIGGIGIPVAGFTEDAVRVP